MGPTLLTIMKSTHLLFVILVGLTVLVSQTNAGSKAQKAEDLKFYQGLLAKIRDANGKLAALRAAEGRLAVSERPTEKQRKALEKEIRATVKEVKAEMSNEDNKDRLLKAQTTDLKEHMVKIEGFFDGEKIGMGKGPELVDQSANRIGMGASAATTETQARTSAPPSNAPQFGAAAEAKQATEAKENKEKDKAKK
jgi:hypothetical protein